MIGAALSRRSGRLKLGLRLGKPPIVVPGATLDNTLGTSTITPATTVQNFTSAWGAPIRSAFAAKGVTLSNDDSRAVNVIAADYIAAAEAAATPSFPAFSIANAATVSEGDPTPPAFTIANAATVSEGN
ncbi:hypothetical protein [Sphingomonas sp. 1P08PE]|uniref:hypothetical protein n=1 Tax=Sphingomonas sp. 1P08PE TaxID=554122 RepID=UPI0039A29910